MVDPHTIATFAFARIHRDPEFGRMFPWVRNTVVCIESDLADDVLNEQMRQHFPGGGTIACYYPQEHRIMFIWVDAHNEAGRGRPHSAEPDTIVADDKQRKLTIGMLIDSVYRDREGDWSHLPVWGGDAERVAQMSTVEAEKKLALT